MSLKNFVFIIGIVLVVFSGCKKDGGSGMNLTSADIGAINAQLKGSWVFPVKSLTVVDSAGKPVQPSQNLPASAYTFDGYSTVTIRPDPQTILHGTYVLSTTKDGIFVKITNPDATVVNFQVVQLSSQTLTLISTQPYVYYNGSVLLPTIALTSTTLQKESAADVTGHLVRVSVKNDSIFSVKVYITQSATGKMVLMDSLVNTSKSYSLAFEAQPNDKLKVDVIGNFLKTSINAYINGLPINGDILNTSVNETITSNGWIVQYPKQ